MSVSNPANRITRWSVVGMEGMWTKMWDPPTTSPNATDEILLVPQGQIRPNPVPDVLFAAGFQSKPSRPHLARFDLMHGLSIPTWDGKKNLAFFVIGDPANPAASGGTYPGPTLRMPRGVIFSAETSGKGPPPHTIHWHGIEPTPLNDGVGHTAMEIGNYTYQWQPNFMGFYFAHCHRNTVQHFEYGLYFAMIFEAPDAYFGSIASTNADGTVVLKDLTQFPIGGGRDGRRRVACNLDDPLTGLPRFTQFPGFNRNPLDTPDPGPAAADTQISFPTDPHAMTVPFDVESLLAFDDRDSVWSDMAPSAHVTFPKHGSIPGVNDEFARNPGVGGFAAFNDYNADYWFVTGVPVVPPNLADMKTGTIPPGIVVPTELMSGISGVQVSINAQINQTILVRIICAAYNCLRVTFPVDVVVVAWDGRALGVAPYGHNESYLVPKNTPINMTVARRFDCLIREATPLAAGSTIKAEFINNKSQVPEDLTGEQVVMTALVPISIGGAVVVPPAFTFTGKVLDQLGAPVAAGCSVHVAPKSLGGAPAQTVPVVNGDYTITGMTNGTYEVTAIKPGKLFTPASQIVTCQGANLVVPNLVASIADFAPHSYTLPDSLNSLQDVVGLRIPTPLEKLRYDVAPLLPTPGDGIIDIRDSLNLLRMVVGLPPQ